MQIPNWSLHLPYVATDTVPVSPQQGAWWWQTPVILSPILCCCWWPEWSQTRSELSLQYFPNLFCTCLSVLYSEALSMSLICILSSTLLVPFLLFPYGLLHSLPGIPYSIFLHLPLSPTLIPLSLQGPFSIFLISPPAAFSKQEALFFMWSLLILTPLPHSARMTQTHLILSCIFHHLYKLVWCTVQVYTLCNVIT